MKFGIIMTFSKIMALIITLEVGFLVYVTKDITLFTISIPFISALILGKQAFDSKK